MISRTLRYFTDIYYSDNNPLRIKAEHTVVLLILITLSVIIETMILTIGRLNTTIEAVVGFAVALFFAGLLFVIRAGKLELAINIFIPAGAAKLVQFLVPTFTNQFYLQIFLVLILAIAIYAKRYQYYFALFMTTAFSLGRIFLVDAPQMGSAELLAHYKYQIYQASAGVIIFTIAVIFYEQVIQREIQSTFQLKVLAETDILTGLYNREKFNQTLANLKANNTTYCLALFDIDFFKRINDQYGHQAGDDVLRDFAACLKEYYDHEMVFRWGGEEFALIAAESGETEAVADQLELFRQSVADHDFGIGESVTVSIGYVCSKAFDTSDAVMVYADQALYNAKHKGRNRIELMTAQEDW